MTVDSIDRGIKATMAAMRAKFGQLERQQDVAETTAAKLEVAIMEAVQQMREALERVPRVRSGAQANVKNQPRPLALALRVVAMTGDEAVHRVRSLRFGGVPLHVLGYGQDDDQVQGLAGGVAVGA